MIRSRLIFITLLLAYLGVTPAGMYTCACLIPVQPALEQVHLGEVSEQSSFPNTTAVATLLSFFSLTFMMAATFILARRWKYRRCYEYLWLEPKWFCEPPPTPPPHFI